MANEGQLKILKRGHEAWNAWRRDNQDIHIDLSGVDLIRVNLFGMHLQRADLRRANLRGADLNLAFLGQADLSKANLTGANLTGANLMEANLTGADLEFANLSLANLSLTNLSETQLNETIFNDVDLSQVAGLATCIHRYQSCLDSRTLIRSGPLPLNFLRGCGLSDKYIKYIPSLFQDTVIQFYSCFISYSSADVEFAKRLHADLQNVGVRCWFAPEDVKSGEKLYDQIDMAIRVHDKLLLVLSEHSIASEWVTTELRRCRRAEKKENRRKLFPLRLTSYETLQDWECFDADYGKDLAVEVREYFIPDFSNWKDYDSYQLALDRLLRDLKESEKKKA